MPGDIPISQNNVYNTNFSFYKIYLFNLTFACVLVTFPVNDAFAKISISTLSRVKTWLRSRISKDGLSDLHLLNAHRE